MNRSKFTQKKLCLFIQRKLETLANSKIPLLDIFESYKQFAESESVPAASANDLSSQIVAIYKVKVENGIVQNVGWKTAWQHEKEEQIKVNKQDAAMQLKYRRFLHDYGYESGSGFTSKSLANFSTSDLSGGNYSPGFAKQDEEFVRDWLRSEPNTFERDGKFYYRLMH